MGTRKRCWHTLRAYRCRRHAASTSTAHTHAVYAPSLTNYMLRRGGGIGTPASSSAPRQTLSDAVTADPQPGYGDTI